MYPKHPDSPFYGGGPIKPLATVTLTKVKESCGGDDRDQSSEDIPSTEDLIDMMKKKMMMTKKLGKKFSLNIKIKHSNGNLRK